MLAHNVLIFIAVAAMLLVIIGYCSIWVQNTMDELREELAQTKMLLQKSENARKDLIRQLGLYTHVGTSLRGVVKDLKE